MSDYVPDQYENRHNRDQLHRSRRRNCELQDALASLRREFIARGGTESDFARQCGLALSRLQELIGRHEDSLTLETKGWLA